MCTQPNCDGQHIAMSGDRLMLSSIWRPTTAQSIQTDVGMSKRILVIEDMEDNRRILRDLLSNAGFALIEAVDGEKGIVAAAEHRPDLILMDIQLPIVDGYEATRKIKANPDLRHIPIIAVTSYALSGDEAKAVAAGCDGYVAKPFSSRQVVAKIREFLS
jgi:two-component system, cell cycle response regulator DivK